MEPWNITYLLLFLAIIFPCICRMSREERRQLLGQSPWPVSASFISGDNLESWLTGASQQQCLIWTLVKLQQFSCSSPDFISSNRPQQITSKGTVWFQRWNPSFQCKAECFTTINFYTSLAFCGQVTTEHLLRICINWFSQILTIWIGVINSCLYLYYTSRDLHYIHITHHSAH